MMTDREKQIVQSLKDRIKELEYKQRYSLLWEELGRTLAMNMRLTHPDDWSEAQKQAWNVSAERHPNVAELLLLDLKGEAPRHK